MIRKLESCFEPRSVAVIGDNSVGAPVCDTQGRTIAAVAMVRR